MLRVIIETVNHNQQRYDTCGDWQYDLDSTLRLRVSNLADARLESLIAIHELVEALLCRFRLIPEDVVDRFDRDFKGEGEPGDAPGCPYRSEHFTATNIERLLAEQLNVNWDEYETKLNSLQYR